MTKQITNTGSGHYCGKYQTIPIEYPNLLIKIGCRFALNDNHFLTIYLLSPLQ